MSPLYTVRFIERAADACIVRVDAINNELQPRPAAPGIVVQAEDGLDGLMAYAWG